MPSLSKLIAAARDSLAVGLCLFLCAVPNSGLAADPMEYHDNSKCSPNGIALGGYDVVAYHTLNAAVMGEPEITLEYDELSYQFSNESHKQLFIEDPEKWLPHFRGWCAIALARNKLTCPDFKNFKIENGQLLLFETIAFINGKSVWESNPEKNRISAESNYQRILIAQEELLEKESENQALLEE